MLPGHNNLPADLGRHTVFRDGDYAHTLVFPGDYPLPVADNIQMKVRNSSGKVVDGVTATIEVDINKITFKYSKEHLQLIPGLYNQCLYLSGVPLLQGELYTCLEAGLPTFSQTQVNITEQATTVVSIDNSVIIESLVQQIADLQEYIQQVEDSAVKRYTVENYEEAEPLFDGDKEVIVWVKADVYNYGDPSFYTYHPQMGIAQFGFEYNYK